ncbi:hypothetical protein BJX66DRAFT_331029 [Aspergillus keveii]|uniref:Uncharacterized protein n=1 Tax=Aspergillus keveii TaxID=714993 RepID=A0ABR4FHL6_9EURO
MGRRGYRSWSNKEEENLQDWVAQRSHLTWPEKADEYSSTICPRSSEALRSKLRQLKEHITQRRALEMRHLRRRRGMMAKATGGRQQAAVVPSQSAPCPRYISSRQICAGMHRLPFAENRPVCRNTLSANANAASRHPDQSKSVKKPSVHDRIDLSPQSTKKPTRSFQLTRRLTRSTNLMWHIVYSLAGREGHLRSTQAKQRE